MAPSPSGFGCCLECDLLVAVCSRLIPYLEWTDLSRLIIVSKCVREFIRAGHIRFDFDADRVLPHLIALRTQAFSRSSDPLEGTSLIEGDWLLMLTHIRSIQYNQWNRLVKPRLSLLDLRWLVLKNAGSLCHISMQGHLSNESLLPSSWLRDLHVQLLSGTKAGPTSPIVAAESHDVSPQTADPISQSGPLNPKIMPVPLLTFPFLTHLEWSLFGETTPMPPIDGLNNLKSITLRYENWLTLEANHLAHATQPRSALHSNLDLQGGIKPNKTMSLTYVNSEAQESRGHYHDPLVQLLQRHAQEHLDLGCSFWDVFRFRSLRPPFFFTQMKIARADGWTELAVLLCRAFIARHHLADVRVSRPVNGNKRSCVDISDPVLTARRAQLESQRSFQVMFFLIPAPQTPQQQALSLLLDRDILSSCGVNIDAVIQKTKCGPRDVCIKEDLLLKHLILYTCSDLAPLIGLDTVTELCRKFISAFFVVKAGFIIPKIISVTPNSALQLSYPRMWSLVKAGLSSQLSLVEAALVPPNPHVCANCGETADFCRWQSEWSTASLGNPTDQSAIDPNMY